MADELLNNDAPAERPSMYEIYTPVEQEPEQSGPGFYETLKRASEQTNLATSALISSYENSLGFRPDPNYNYQDYKEELRKDVPPEYWAELARSTSKEHAEFIKWNIKDELEGIRQVQDAGYKGTAALLVTGLLSPENIVPLGAAYGWANKGGRIKTALKTGAVTAGAAAAAESVLVDNRYTKDAEDILYAASFGFVLGGAVGGITGGVGRAARAADDIAPQADNVPTPRDATVPGATPEPVRVIPEAPKAFGPPKPEIVTTRTQRAIQRREGPIDIDTHVKVNALFSRLQNIDVNTASTKVKESIAKDFAAIDHRASLDTETAERLEQIYDIVNYRPYEEVITTETIAGSWKSLEEDMAYAANVLRADMDKALVDDLSNVSGGSAGAALSNLYPHQILPVSEREDDIIEAARDFIVDKGIREQAESSVTNKVAKGSKILASDFTRLINHPSAVVKKIAYDLLEGGTGSITGRGITAAQFKDIIERRILSKGLIPLNQNYSEWATSKGMSMMSRRYWTTGMDQFYEDVRVVLENRAVGRELGEIHPNVKDAADRWDEMMEYALKTAQESGVESVQGIPTKSGYVPLVWNGQKVMKVDAQYGKGTAKKVIMQGYRSVGIDDEMAEKIATAVVNTAVQKRAGIDTNIAGLLQKNQRDQLAAQLNRMGLSSTDITSFLRRLDAREAQAGPAFTKGRTNIDLTISLGNVRLRDLVDNDLNTIASTYAREIAGRSALAQKGITSDSKWNAIKSAAMKDSSRLNALNESGDDNLGQLLDDIRSYFSAFPVAGGINANARRIQQTTTLSMLGMVGLAQLAELGTIIGRSGIKAAFKSMPSISEAFTLAKRVKSGKDPVIDELRAWIGDFDYDHLLYRPDIVLDDKITDSIDSRNWVRIADKALGKANTVLGYASGMNSVRHFEHQLAGKLIVNKFVDLALNPAKRAKSLARLDDIGVSSTDLDRIVAEIGRHSEVNPNGTMKKMNLDRWNPKTAETFTFAINKHIAQVVQRQLVGETSAWMHKTLGSLLSQFRHFPIVAFEKQLLRNLHFHDQALYTTLLYGFAVSFGIQAIRAGLNGDDINSPDTFKKTVNYMGMASVAPDILTIAAQMGIAPEALNFRKMGHTGAYADKFDLGDMIPAVGQVNRTVQLAGAPFKAVTGDLSQSDVRSSMMALPFATTLFSKSLMQLLLEDAN